MSALAQVLGVDRSQVATDINNTLQKRQTAALATVSRTVVPPHASITLSNPNRSRVRKFPFSEHLQVAQAIYKAGVHNFVEAWEIARLVSEANGTKHNNYLDITSPEILQRFITHPNLLRGIARASRMSNMQQSVIFLTMLTNDVTLQNVSNLGFLSEADFSQTITQINAYPYIYFNGEDPLDIAMFLSIAERHGFTPEQQQMLTNLSWLNQAIQMNNGPIANNLTDQFGVKTGLSDLFSEGDYQMIPLLREVLEQMIGEFGSFDMTSMQLNLSTNNVAENVSRLHNLITILRSGISLRDESGEPSLRLRHYDEIPIIEGTAADMEMSHLLAIALGTDWNANLFSSNNNSQITQYNVHLAQLRKHLPAILSIILSASDAQLVSLQGAIESGEIYKTYNQLLVQDEALYAALTDRQDSSGVLHILSQAISLRNTLSLERRTAVIKNLYRLGYLGDPYNTQPWLVPYIYPELNEAFNEVLNIIPRSDQDVRAYLVSVRDQFSVLFDGTVATPTFIFGLLDYLNSHIDSVKSHQALVRNTINVYTDIIAVDFIDDEFIARRPKNEQIYWRMLNGRRFDFLQDGLLSQFGQIGTWFTKDGYPTPAFLTWLFSHAEIRENYSYNFETISSWLGGDFLSQFTDTNERVYWRLFAHAISNQDAELLSLLQTINTSTLSVYFTNGFVKPELLDAYVSHSVANHTLNISNLNSFCSILTEDFQKNPTLKVWAYIYQQKLNPSYMGGFFLANFDRFDEMVQNNQLNLHGVFQVLAEKKNRDYIKYFEKELQGEREYSDEFTDINQFRIVGGLDEYAKTFPAESKQHCFYSYIASFSTDLQIFFINQYDHFDEIVKDGKPQAGAFFDAVRAFNPVGDVGGKSFWSNLSLYVDNNKIFDQLPADEHAYWYVMMANQGYTITQALFPYLQKDIPTLFTPNGEIKDTLLLAILAETKRIPKNLLTWRNPWFAANSLGIFDAIDPNIDARVMRFLLRVRSDRLDADIQSGEHFGRESEFMLNQRLYYFLLQQSDQLHDDISPDWKYINPSVIESLLKLKDYEGYPGSLIEDIVFMTQYIDPASTGSDANFWRAFAQAKPVFRTYLIDKLKSGTISLNNAHEYVDAKGFTQAFYDQFLLDISGSDTPRVHDFIAQASKKEWVSLFGDTSIKEFLAVLPGGLADEKRNAFTHNDNDRTSQFLLFLAQNYESSEFVLSIENFAILKSYIAQFGLSKTPSLFRYFKYLTLHAQNPNLPLPEDIVHSGITTIDVLKERFTRIQTIAFSQEELTDVSNLSAFELEILSLVTKHSVQRFPGHPMDEIVQAYETAKQENLILPLPDGYSSATTKVPLVSVTSDLSKITGPYNSLRQDILDSIADDPANIERPKKSLLDILVAIDADTVDRHARGKLPDEDYASATETVAQLRAAINSSTNIDELLGILVATPIKQGVFSTYKKDFISVMRQLVFRKVFTRHNQSGGIEEIRSLLEGPLSISAISRVIDIVQNYVKSHVLNLTSNNEEAYWTAQVFALINENRSTNDILDYLRADINLINGFMKELEVAEKSEKMTVHFIPDRGLVGEMAGYCGGVCYTKVFPLLKQYPNLVPFKIVSENPTTGELEIIGSVLVFEVPDAEGKPIMVVRAFDVRDEATLNVETLFESFADHLATIAKARGITRIVAAGTGGTISNFPMITNYVLRRYVDGKPNVPIQGIFDFNGYNITNNLFLIRTVSWLPIDLNDILNTAALTPDSPIAAVQTVEHAADLLLAPMDSSCSTFHLTERVYAASIPCSINNTRMRRIAKRMPARVIMNLAQTVERESGLQSTIAVNSLK